MGESVSRFASGTLDSLFSWLLRLGVVKRGARWDPHPHSLLVQVHIGALRGDVPAVCRSICGATRHGHQHEQQQSSKPMESTAGMAYFCRTCIRTLMSTMVVPIHAAKRIQLLRLANSNQVLLRLPLFGLVMIKRTPNASKYTQNPTTAARMIL